jgi:hypothetical protein
MNQKQREAARTALLAHAAMETTKGRHFDFLQLLENRKKKFNLSPSELENALLKELLADHDAAVAAFRTESASLREADAEAFTALFAHIAQFEQALAPIRDAE